MALAGVIAFIAPEPLRLRLCRRRPLAARYGTRMRMCDLLCFFHMRASSVTYNTRMRIYVSIVRIRLVVRVHLIVSIRLFNSVALL